MARNYYAELFYHIVWRTKRSEARIAPEIEARVYAAIKNICAQADATPIEVGGIEDHVHLLVSTPPTIQLAVLIGKIKGASSHFINERLSLPRRFGWAEGYGVLSLAKVNVPAVRAYIRNQREHHKKGTTRTKMERIEASA